MITPVRNRIVPSLACRLAFSFCLLTIALPALPEVAGQEPDQKAPSKKPLLVAHRGASGYAPEHTRAAYELAIEQGADFVEQDLQVTRDGVLICLHDPDLARTTNVAEIFPNRARLRDPGETGIPKRGWYTIDFTLAEIKRLDAGAWYNRANPFAANASYVGQQVPTMEETIKQVGNRAGLYIEIKHYPFYKSSGFDVATKLAALLRKHGFDRGDLLERIYIQSFHKEALLRMRMVAPGFRRIQLLPMEDIERRNNTTRITPDLASEIASYARGAGPGKSMIANSGDVATLHGAGLLVHPYTFRGTTSANARRPLNEAQSNGSTLKQNIVSDIRRYLSYGVDGGFADYPDLWKEAAAAPGGKNAAER